jgi:hypothetical protein
LLLVLMVGAGVSVLAVAGWIVSLQPLYAAALGVLILIGVSIGMRELRKRMNKHQGIE